MKKLIITALILLIVATAIIYGSNKLLRHSAAPVADTLAGYRVDTTIVRDTTPYPNNEAMPSHEPIPGEEVKP